MRNKCDENREDKVLSVMTELLEKQIQNEKKIKKLEDELRKKQDQVLMTSLNNF